MRTLRTFLLFVVAVVALGLNDTSAQTAVEKGENTSTIGPLPVYLPNPDFPKKLRKKNEHGELVFRITIGTDGRTKDIVLSRGNPSLGKVAMEAIRQWHYLPALCGDKFIETAKEITIQYDFRKDALAPQEPLSDVPRVPQEDMMVEVEAGELFPNRTGYWRKASKGYLLPTARVFRRGKTRAHSWKEPAWYGRRIGWKATKCLGRAGTRERTGRTSH